MHIPDRLEQAGVSRREIIVLGVGAFLVAAFPFSRRLRETLIRRSVPLMGTIAEIAVLHSNPRYAHDAIDAALEELSWVERTMTKFSPKSDVGRVNSAAATAPVPVSHATAAVLKEALRWAEASEGAFDPCLGKSVALWDVAKRRQPPRPDRVHRLAGRKLYRALDIDTSPAGPVVEFHDADVAIDVGGIAKGYGVDCAVQVLKRWRIGHALVNVGGDLYALGRSEDGDPWKVGIRSPDNPLQLAGTLAVADEAVATSGDYMQFFDHQGRRYHHLLDPATGAPRASTVHSVTVKAERCVTADAAATAVFGISAAAAEWVLRSAATDARIVRQV